ncbi:MXAN_2562 family outer membrane beta-barrel protein [Cystobacter fuscus]
MARAVALGVAVLLTALPGQAQVYSSDAPTESPRGGAVELRLGSYRPQIDAEEGVSGSPFTAIYGEGRWWLFELELQRFFYQGIGTAGLSLSAGYSEKFGYALTKDKQTPSSERTSFHVVPLHLRGVYRFDYPAFQWGFPLVPYVKPGLVFVPWWATKGGKLDEAPATEGTDGGEGTPARKGRGVRFGWEVAVGLSFMLDVLEPRFARDFDSDLGINHSYIFAEYTYSKVNSFGQPGLNLSDSYWMFGLALDY